MVPCFITIWKYCDEVSENCKNTKIHLKSCFNNPLKHNKELPHEYDKIINERVDWNTIEDGDYSEHNLPRTHNYYSRKKYFPKILKFEESSKSGKKLILKFEESSKSGKKLMSLFLNVLFLPKIFWFWNCKLSPGYYSFYYSF